jgi:hypothetical protein
MRRPERTYNDEVRLSKEAFDSRWYPRWDRSEPFYGRVGAAKRLSDGLALRGAQLRGSQYRATRRRELNQCA